MTRAAVAGLACKLLAVLVLAAVLAPVWLIAGRTP